MKKKRKFWLWVKSIIKDPIALITFGVVWVLLESPAIFGMLAFWLTGKEAWLALFTSWVALTALPLPIPVAPISLGAAIAMHHFVRKRRRKLAQKQQENTTTAVSQEEFSAQAEEPSDDADGITATKIQ